MNDTPDSRLAAGEVLQVSLEEKMRSSYLDYAMSVIVGRALPDSRDGLKPVHRRIFYAMLQAGNEWNKPYKKSARIVGDVLGKFHPHGQDAVYDALVRMAQNFSMRHVLIDGQGNFGSVDGDNPAAMRYTEVRMAKIAQQLLEDIDKDTIDFVPNYDGAEQEPTVLPARFPNLLINGSSGIAVGMATNIPPHNLSEVIDASLHLLKNPNASIDDLMNHVKAPDFPTAGIIYGMSGVREAYNTGRGRVLIRGKTHFETREKSGGRTAIIVDELPYQVNKATLISKIADLVRSKKMEGISDLRDESDRHGMRIVIELKRGTSPEIVLNHLYRETQLQDSFGVNMVSLVDGAPKLQNLKELISRFIEHRRVVVRRRTQFELARAKQKAHLLEGYAVGLANVDEVIATIKSSKTPKEAKDRLMEKLWESKLVSKMLAKMPEASDITPHIVEEEYGLVSSGTGNRKAYRLSGQQAQAILDLRLQRLTAMEQDKVIKEYIETVDLIIDLHDILKKDNRITTIIGKELKATQKQFAEPRRSEIVEHSEEIDIEDLITPEQMVITLSHKGYIKTQPLDSYRAQRRGGRGKRAANTKDQDFIDKMFVANTHDYVLFFSSRGKVYWLKVYAIPVASGVSRGKPIVNLLPLMDHEKIQAVLPVKAKDFSEDQFVIMATERGIVKKTSLKSFSRPRKGGIIAVTLQNDDNLINAEKTSGDSTVMLFSNAGKVAYFEEKSLRATGRSSKGVRGMRLADNQKICSLLTSSSKKDLVLTVTENGYGKKTPIENYALKHRGGKGVIAINANERNGAVVGSITVGDKNEVMLIASNGVLIRTRVKEIRKTSRTASGVRLIRLDDNTRLVSVELIAEEEIAEEEIDTAKE